MRNKDNSEELNTLIAKTRNIEGAFYLPANNENNRQKALIENDDTQRVF
jgi:hypothetical protein